MHNVKWHSPSSDGILTMTALCCHQQMHSIREDTWMGFIPPAEVNQCNQCHWALKLFWWLVEAQHLYWDTCFHLFVYSYKCNEWNMVIYTKEFINNNKTSHSSSKPTNGIITTRGVFFKTKLMSAWSFPLVALRYNAAVKTKSTIDSNFKFNLCFVALTQWDLRM